VLGGSAEGMIVSAQLETEHSQSDISSSVLRYAGGNDSCSLGSASDLQTLLLKLLVTLPQFALPLPMLTGTMGVFCDMILFRRL